MSAELPLRRRRAARVVVLDADDAILLLHDSDPGGAGRPAWWITPGGGIEGDEAPEAAAVRELREETGLGVEVTALTGPVWQRRVTHVFSDHVAVQDETFFILQAVRFTPTSGGFTDSEKASVLGHRWWSLAELRVTTDDLWPRELPDLLAPVLDGQLPAEVRNLPAAFEDPGGGP